MLGRAAADAGFEVHATVEDLPEADRTKTLYLSIIASQFRGQGTQGVTFYVATSARIAVCEALVPSLMGKNSFVERAAMQSTELIVERLGYGGFNQALMSGISERSGSFSTPAAINSQRRKRLLKRHRPLLASRA